PSSSHATDLDVLRRGAQARGAATRGAARARGVWSAGAAVGGVPPWFGGAAAVGAATNGAVSGWRGVYGWGCAPGLIAFVLDSTWSILMTTAGLFALTVASCQHDPGYVDALSSRRHRHVYERGFMPRRGFAITLGNVIGGAGDQQLARRRRLVTDHEDVHCWQARWFGPLYPLLYVGWLAVGAAVGAVWWALGRRDQRPFAVVETVSYYLNPFEWWAYSRHGYWPPLGKVPDLGWRHPCCRPLADRRHPEPDPAGPVTR
ncbi:MAG: hypothetical protein AAGG08_11680, partial [Actinomycetota bacterium]